MLRIATSGWLTIGVWKRPASLPALVTVKVESRTCSARQRACAGALGELRDLGSELVDGLLVRATHDRDDEPLVGLHRDADVVAVEVHDRVPVEPRVELRELDERVAHALTTVGRSRSSATSSKSHSSTQVTGGTSRCARAMCSAITRRTPRSGSRRPSAALRRRARTSSSVTRPPGPVPVTAARSTPSSCAIRRTTGVAWTLSAGAAVGVTSSRSRSASTVPRRRRRSSRRLRR